MFGSPTLTIYFAKQFARTTFVIFAVVFALLAIVDYFELVRRSIQHVDFSAFQYLLVSLFRVPLVIERALPFAVLFAAISSLVVANRKLELVAARAAGLSAWQFLLPAGLVAVGIGIFATTVFNPIATDLKERSITLASRLDNSTQREAAGGEASKPLWLRQSGPDGSSIIGARQATDRGLSLVDVTAFVFAKDGTWRRRIDAATAHFDKGEWVFERATVTDSGSEPKTVPEVRLATSLGANEVSKSLADPETVSFWSLPQLVDLTSRAGVPADPYEMRYQSLLAQPMLLLAMVFIAATVSLRFSRSRDLGQLILTGVAVGFMLYVVTEIARRLGGSGVVPPVLAAWTPAIVATLMSITVLLHREDG